MNESLTYANNQNDDWNEFDFSEIQNEKPSFVTELNIKSTLSFLAIGAAAGVLSWLLTLMFNAWIIRPVFCQNVDTAAICAASDATAFYISLAVVGVFALIYFSKRIVARSLLIVLATFVSLAAFWVFLDRSMFENFLILAFFGALLSLLFARLTAIRSYFWAIIFSFVIVALLWFFISL